jgi:hypothetical protein
MDLLNLRSLYFDERLSIAATDYAQFANQDSVLCIDNGATTLRAGWNREQDPRLAGLVTMSPSWGART